MTNRSQPNWQPIEFLPICTTILQEMFQTNEEQYQALSKAKNQLYLLDDHTIQRVKNLYEKQKDDLWIWEEQLEQWSKLELNSAQKSIIQALQCELEKIQWLADTILTMAREIELHTINRIFDKDEEELAQEFFSDPEVSHLFENGKLEILNDTVKYFSKHEEQYKNLQQTLCNIFERFTPKIPPPIAETCILRLGIKPHQLQNDALYFMLVDYCLFDYSNGGKSLSFEYMDDCIPHLSNPEILVFHDFQKATFTVLEVKAILMGNAIAAYDLLHQKHMIVFDEGLSKSVLPGLLIICHLVHSSEVVFTTDVVIVIGPQTSCGHLIHQEISNMDFQNYDKESYATKILQIIYQNI